MTDQPTTWSRKKKDLAPRGVFRHGSGVWAVRFTCGAGHIHQERVGPVKTEAISTYHSRRSRAVSEAGWCPRAEQLAARREAARRAATAPITVKGYAERWLKEVVAVTCKPRTAELYASVFKRHIFPTLGAIALGDVSREQIRELLADKAAGEHSLSRATLSNIVVPLRAMLNTAVEDGRIPSNPAQRLGRFSRGLSAREARTVTALTAEELARILGAADKYTPDAADLLHVLAWTGLRLGEACGVQWGDLDLAGRFLEVRRTVAVRGRRDVIGSPKSGQARRVDVPTALITRLRERWSIGAARAALQGRALGPWVFPALADETRPVNAEHVRFKIWYPLLRHAGVRDVRLHDLRHTYASLLLQAGEPLGYVKAQLGHSSIQVTVDRYGHFIPGANRQAVERLAQATTAPDGAVELRRNLNEAPITREAEEADTK